MADNPMPEAAENLLAELRGRYPQAFPADPQAPAPLALGIHKRLAAAGHGGGAMAALLAAYARAPAYLAALAAGQPRVGLDGEPAGEVTEAQRALARSLLDALGAEPGKRLSISLAGAAGATHPPQSKRPMPQIELTAALAKIALAIDPEAFRAVLDVDSAGAKAVLVAVAADGKQYTAQLNPKSFRKAQAAFREAANPAVSLSGTLKGSVVESAGIQVFDKGAKDAAA
jgi:hypothetical protein